MIRPELDEQLALHALDALPPAEVAAVEAAVAGSTEVAARLEEHRAAIAELVRHVALDPPPELKSQVLAAAFAEQPAQDVVEQDPPNVVIPFTRAARRRWAAGLVGVAVAVAAVAAIAVISLRGDDQHAPLVAEAVLAGPATARLSAAVYDDGQIQLTGAELPPVDSGKTYQLWMIDGSNGVRSAGVFTPAADGALDAELHGALDGAVSMAVTVEPSGGSASPSGPITFQGAVVAEPSAN